MKFWLNTIIEGCIVIFIVVLIFCGCSFFQNACDEPVITNAPVDSTWLREKAVYPSKDTIAIPKAWEKYSGVFKTIDDRDHAIKAEQERILTRHNEVLDDIRQETNNYINKVNGWLSLWIGVIALLGVGWPIVLQYKMKDDYQKELEELRREKETLKEEYGKGKEELRGEKENLKEVLGKEITELRREKEELKEALGKEKTELRDDLSKEKEELRKEKETLKEEYRKDKEELRKEKDRLKYDHLCRTTTILHTYRLLGGVVDRRYSREFVQYWALIHENLDRVVEDCFDKETLKVDRYRDLLDVLIPLYGVVHEHHVLPNDIHHRKFDELVDLIGKLIGMLTQGENLRSKQIYKDLQTLSEKFSKAYSDGV